MTPTDENPLARAFRQLREVDKPQRTTKPVIDTADLPEAFRPLPVGHCFLEAGYVRDYNAALKATNTAELWHENQSLKELLRHAEANDKRMRAAFGRIRDLTTDIDDGAPVDAILYAILHEVKEFVP